MTDPKHQADHAWRDAEALVERVELAARSGMSAKSFFEDLTGGLRLTMGASAVTIWFTEGNNQTILSRSGIALHQQRETNLPEQAPSQTAVQDQYQAPHASRSHWKDSHCEFGARLLATQRAYQDVELGLDLDFDRGVDAGLRQPYRELVEVVLDLAATVFLRCRLLELRGEIGDQSTRDALIGRMHDGVTLTDSFAAIASAIASETSVDRVSLLRCQSSKYRLVTTSSQSRIDRRARQVRMLETLADSTLSSSDRFWFTVGSPSETSAETNETLDRYVHESGCREVYIESLWSDDEDRSIAAVVLERFRLPPSDRPIQSLLDPIREPMDGAIRNAIRREDAPWGLIAGRLTGTTRRKAWSGAIAACVLILAACFVPATLKIPAEGRIVAADRSRLFAPTGGIVAEIAVKNGQHVRTGETLLFLRSPDLDLQQRNIEAALSTAQTRLGSLIALRSRSGNQASRQREPNVSADEKALKSEIEGLEDQLQLVHRQQADLSITSPIDGRVDRWDLQQSLNARPVTHGQHLLDVVSTDDRWRVELDLPDKHVNYVLNHQRLRPCRCTFRLRSNPTTIHEGTIRQVEDVAHLNPLGQSMVRVTLELQSGETDDFRSGATVLAQLHCGRRPIGFVWLRGIFEWSRSQIWF